jgi:superfamily II DNA or RNA helicase
MKLKLPPVLSIDETHKGNIIQQLALPPCTIEATVADYTAPFLKAKLLIPTNGQDDRILLLAKRGPAPDRFARIIAGTPRQLGAPVCLLDVSDGTWLRHPRLPGTRGVGVEHRKEVERVLSSWEGSFSYAPENVQQGIKGLRPPQLGALHAVHAHWSTTDATATIVMPTGTGKTETMLSVLVSTPCRRVLVVVPTDALRTQIAEKFLTLGILKDEDCQILSPSALYPVVGVLKHKPKELAEIDLFFESCNVVVTTSHIAGQCSEALQERIAHHCPFLFIDEAHHAEAPTWKAFKEKFVAARTLQFSATPFREDDKLIDGKIIYRYPLRKAQEEGYFRPIHFKSVVEFNPAKSDEAIAATAIEQLRQDAPYQHVLMARVGTVDRARQVFKIYEKYKEFKPVELHTGIKSQGERLENRRRILSGESKVVVCVDMLGEGFDLPELKVAAFHDIKKSLPVTLQLAGRFTRSRPDLGDATFIANVADVDVQDELRKLYTQDPDWNLLLPELSEEIIQEQISVKEFLDGFAAFPNDIPLKSLRPATSAVVYRTRCKNWTPERFWHGIPGIAGCARVHHSLNRETNTLVVVTARRVPIEWAEVDEIYSWDWELYVLIWDPVQKLLFINNSSNSGDLKDLGQAVAGDDAELIRDKPLFRCFAGVNRLRLTNVGLTEQFGRLVRYTGRMGADVQAGLSEAQKRNARKAVLFGNGYENGTRTSVGVSRKGRVWSFRRVRLDALAAWCGAIGAKILDETIDPDQILQGTLESEVVAERPRRMPIAIDWPEEVYREVETSYSMVLEDGIELLLYDTGLELVNPTENGELRFKLFSDDVSLQLELMLFENGGTRDYMFSVLDGRRGWLGHKLTRIPIEQFFYENPPVIWFVDGSSLEGNQFTPLKTKYPPWDRSKIQARDWAGTNLTKESQGMTREPDSIQFKVIAEVLNDDSWDIVFDDDGAGEAADIVAIRVVEKDRNFIDVSLYHCKYSGSVTPGQRIDDLYVVCGQAQKSVYWMYSSEKQTDLFSHLLRREPKRRRGYETSRFQKGDRDMLIRIREMSRTRPLELRVFIVQPGLSKAMATREQLELLSVTENYLMETYKLPFGVIASP